MEAAAAKPIPVGIQSRRPPRALFVSADSPYVVGEILGASLTERGEN